jgi:uncharacterized protein YaeQ
MALTSTIYKAELQISDMVRNYYHDHALTIACHPSETAERMMVRLLAFALHAHEALAFANKLIAEDEPDLWQKDLTGAIDLWIEVGQPTEKRMRKACGRAKQVYIYCYSGQSAAIWWEQARSGVERAGNLTVIKLPALQTQALGKLARRQMHLQCTIQEEQIWMVDQENTVQIDMEIVKKSADGGLRVGGA